MNILEEELGRALRPHELAEFLGVDEKTVRQYYRELGGMRLGRLYVFFEKEVVHAIQARSQMGGRGEEERHVRKPDCHGSLPSGQRCRVTPEIGSWKLKKVIFWTFYKSCKQEIV